LKRLQNLAGIRVYGDTNPDRSHERVGVIPFNVEGMHHYKAAAILGYEGGVGVRSGCFCAHPYVVHLLQLPAVDHAAWKERVLRGDRSDMPGMLRASFGCYTTMEDVDRFVNMVERAVRGDFQGEYQLDVETGEYAPAGYPEPLVDFFSLE
jgi:selenocysteine lyase/cysteine desulfurase